MRVWTLALLACNVTCPDCCVCSTRATQLEFEVQRHSGSPKQGAKHLIGESRAATENESDFLPRTVLFEQSIAGPGGNAAVPGGGHPRYVLGIDDGVSAPTVFTFLGSR